MFNEGNQIHNIMSSSGSGTVINYGSGSGSDFLTSYGSGYGSGSTSQKVTVPTVPVPVPVPVPQHWRGERASTQARSGSEPGRPAGPGARAGGNPGHDQCHERHCQPGHPQFGQVRAQRGLAVLRRNIQRLPCVQEEI